MSDKKFSEHINLSVDKAMWREIVKLSKHSDKRKVCRRGVELLIQMNKLRDEGMELAMVKNGRIVKRLFEL